LHTELRAGLPPPELTLRLTAPLDVLQARHRRRARPLDIVTADDLPLMERFLDEWMRSAPPSPAPWVVDSSTEGWAVEALAQKLGLIFPD
jgi:hypothetical protein